MANTNLGRIDRKTGGKRDKKILVAQHMLQDAGEKAALTRGSPDLLDRKPSHVEEAGEPCGLICDEGKRLNRQHFCRFTGRP